MKCNSKDCDGNPKACPKYRMKAGDFVLNQITPEHKVKLYQAFDNVIEELQKRGVLQKNLKAK